MMLLCPNVRNVKILMEMENKIENAAKLRKGNRYLISNSLLLYIEINGLQEVNGSFKYNLTRSM